MDYSIIIPAFNEEQFLPRTLKFINEAMLFLPGRGEVIVVDNNSTDRTAEIAHASGARVIFEPVNQISKARNSGAQAALGKYLLFVDADTIAPRTILESAIRALRTGRVCGGGALIGSDMILGSSAQFMLGTWNWVSTTFKLAAGSFMFCLKEGYSAVGGFSEKVYAGEEIFFSRALKRWGRNRGLRFRVLDIERVITSARKLSWHGGRRIARTMLLILVFPLAVRWRSLCGFWYERPEMGGGTLKPQPAPQSSQTALTSA
jgi:glycosyltransferase involved in cell wall biosynthesis